MTTTTPHESANPAASSTNGDSPLEKDFSRHNETMASGNATGGYDDALHRVRTAGSISIPPDLFEKLYLSPENRVKGDLRKTFGNPTPLALIGFLLSLTPLSCDLMGWRGAGGVYLGFGGLLMILGSIGEWIIGNTFPFVVFGTFGAFWLAFACTLIPWFNAYGAYVTDPAEAATSMGNPGNALGLQQPGFFASGAFAFVTSLAGWWIFCAIMLASLDFPFSLPVGDLSRVIKGASERKIEKAV
ncbi:MAG: hypothetical protein OHK93_004488 [Ramalina farinacea]|uniref:Protein alcS n=1 Tax=Ramalina farinacea TaxID=258253 RepID=A0AA43TV36_9LECA|nr:hypothetical protein [Ramalina farinacea]